MRYEDTVDDSRQYLRLALELIGRYGLPTDPVNYCLWYEYAAGRNSELNAAIDRHLGDNGAFSEDHCRRMYDQFIANGRDKVAALVREELKGIFTEIIAAIRSTHQDFSQSEDKLETINGAMAPSLSETDVRDIVNQIKSEIKRLEASSSTFKVQLQQATREIDQLKIKMQQYRSEALMDPLTRIDNRRGFEKRLDLAIDNANRTATDLCLVMADIDHFKKINDTHGHLVGDNVLRMVAATLKESIKGKDHAARIGGEEFAMVLPDTPYAGALKLAENLRRSFEGLDLKKKNTGESLGQVTLSFGVAAYKRTETTDDLVQRADEALYQSKKTGRNRVTGL